VFTGPKNVAVEADADAVPKLNNTCPVVVFEKFKVCAIPDVLPMSKDANVVVNPNPPNVAPSTIKVLLVASKDKLLSTETATPAVPLAVEEVFVNNGKNTPDDALTILILAAVDPEDPVVIGTQDIIPASVDCKTDVPVDGNAIGKVYMVLADGSPALNPVYFVPKGL
jgi:hypothetical protein